MQLENCVHSNLIIPFCDKGKFTFTIDVVMALLDKDKLYKSLLYTLPFDVKDQYTRHTQDEGIRFIIAASSLLMCHQLQSCFSVFLYQT